MLARFNIHVKRHCRGRIVVVQNSQNISFSSKVTKGSSKSEDANDDVEKLKIDEEWMLLFKFQQHYRTVHNYTIAEIMEEFKIPINLKHHLSSHRTAPTNRKECKGYQIRTILREQLFLFANRGVPNRLNKENNDTEYENNALAIVNSSRRRRSVRGGREIIEKRKTAKRKSVILNIKSSSRLSKSKQKQYHENDVEEEEDETDSNSDETALTTIENIHDNEEEEEEDDDEETPQVPTPIRHLTLVNTAPDKTIRLSNASSRALRFLYVCDKKERLIKSFAASLSFFSIAVGTNFEVENNGTTSVVTLSAGSNLDVDVKKFLHLTVCEVDACQDQTPLYANHKINVCSEVIIFDATTNIANRAETAMGQISDGHYHTR